MNARNLLCILVLLLLTGCGATATPTVPPAVHLPTLPPLPTYTPLPLPGALVAATLTPSPTFARTTKVILLSPTLTSSPPTLTETATPIAPEPTDIPQPTSCQPPQNWVVYIVQSNDTLFFLGQRTGVSVAQIQTANCMAGTLIFAGQPLYLPFIPPPPTPSPLLTSTPYHPQTPATPTSTLAATIPAPQPGDPRIDVDPGSGTAGTLFKFKIRDFKPSEAITIKIEDDKNTVIGSFVVTMDSNGDLDYLWTSPNNLQPGFYAVKPSRADGTEGKNGTFIIF